MSKIFVGQGKRVGQYGNIAISICIDDCKEYIKKSNTNGKEYLNLVVSQMREPNQWGKTHTVSIDDWQPSQSNTQNTSQKKEVAEPVQINADDIPF